MIINRRTSLNLRLQSIIFSILVLCLTGLAGWLSVEYNISSDWTKNARNSLSKDTQKLLNEIDAPIDIRSYQPDVEAYVRRANEVFKLYQQHARQLNYRVVNPYLEIDLAKADNIKREGQTHIKIGNNSEVIDDLSEKSISNALIRLSRSKKTTTYFLNGHGERNPENNSPVGYSKLKEHLARIGIESKAINLLTTSLDDKLSDILVIAAPSHDLLEGETDKIKEFIENGGNILWLQDPQPPAQLKTISDVLQIAFPDGIVVDNDKKLRLTLGISHPAIIPILSYEKHLITTDLNYFILLTTATAINIAPENHWDPKRILISQDESWMETEGFTLDPEFNPDQGDIKGPLALGLALHRAIPNSKKQQRAVVIGDSDFIANNNIGQAANLSFITNTINWLSKDDNLITIDTRMSPDTRLNLDQTEVIIISFGFLIIIPLSLLAAGLTIWLKRRNR